MTCSLAQLEANKKNATQSTGPRTPAGKVKSRANGLKHGLTGEGIVLPIEDAKALDERFAILETEMKPRNELARQLVSRIALMTIKLERSAQHEAKAIGHRMRKAEAEFVDARLAEVENYFSWIASEPATNARRLRSTPEGIDRLLRSFEDLKADLTNSYAMQWGWQHCEFLHHMMGLRRVDLPVSRAHALTEAIRGNFRYLTPEDGEGLEPAERMEWARTAQAELLDREIAALRTLREGLDLEGLELDRQEAAHRAIFDASPEAVLARKYEAASERGLYKAIQQLREIQEIPTEVEESQELPATTDEELGSDFPEPTGDIDTIPDIEIVGAKNPTRTVERLTETARKRSKRVRRGKNAASPGR